MKIPKGYHIVRRGAFIRTGDLYFSLSDGESSPTRLRTKEKYRVFFTMIRRNQKKK